MIFYLILSAIANALLSYYLLNIVEEENTNKYVLNRGAWRFYILSALLGPIVIPILLGIIIYVMFIEK